MTPERYQKIRFTFEEVVSQPDTESALSALQLLREQDAELAAEIDELLAIYNNGSHFIERPTALFEDAGTFESSGELKSRAFGPYVLVEILGQGGMGQVWRANQMWPVRRTVALKLIKAGMDTQEVVRRFEAERQALAVMDHPAIAKVFDAGSTPNGRPYFAMEYVEGKPINIYCDQQQLTLAERLNLFIKVCEGIQHAHQKAILHRDIKPSNVLVAEIDGVPSPRIIDFGVARAISTDGSCEPTLTRLGSVLGTPAYMSPEQASIEPASLDTRSDVYSLGVLLYELLIGAVPHNNAGVPLAEVLRALREEPAQRPSARYRALGMDAKIAADRKTNPGELAETLRGDLDIVLLKSLKRNPEARYASAAEFAADVQRYLRDEPIQARPASVLYLARKYVRRHWFAVFAAASMLLLLVAFAVWQTVQIRRVTRERDRADRVAQFMTDMFQVSDPGESRGNQATLREILDRSSRGIEAGALKDPEIQSKLMSVMGRVYLGLGLYGEAERLFRHALALRKQLAGDKSTEVAQSLFDLAAALRGKDNPSAAAQLDRTALDIRKAVLGGSNVDTLKSMNSLAIDMEREGLHREARELQEGVLKADLHSLGPEHPDTLAAMQNLGGLLFTEGKLQDAEGYARTAIKIQQRALGNDHPETLESLHLLGDILLDEGRHSDAEATFRQLLAARKKVLGPEHPDTLRSMKALAVSLNWQKKLEEAEQLERAVVQTQSSVVGAKDSTTLASTSDLAHILADEGKYGESIALARQTVKYAAQNMGPESPKTLFWSEGLASILLQRGALAEAEQIATRTREQQMRVLGEDHAQTARTTYVLARINARKGRVDMAISLLKEAVEHGLTPGYLQRVEHEASFLPLKNVPGFQAILGQIRQRLLTTSRQ
jgi:eukaryotic-like serine/threonine-protein kinase